MFRVLVDSLEDYLAFDPARRPDLENLDALIRRVAPDLTRHFHAGSPAGEPGMRFKMIGYGRLRWAVKPGQEIDWPAIGVALQKNYISVYLAVTRNGSDLIDGHAGTLGQLRRGQNNFSFRKFSDLNVDALSGLIAEAARSFKSDPRNALRSQEPS